MIHEQNTRFVSVVGTVATNATTADVIDRFDSTNKIMYDHCQINVALIKSADETVESKWASLIIQESDNATANFSAISTGGTDFTIPSHLNSDTPSVVQFNIPGGGRKRYYKVLATSGSTNATTYALSAILSRGTQAPNSDSERGVSEAVFVT